MNVPSYTALYCIEADYQDGETIYSNFEDALLRINENQRNILLHKSFFF
jgi:alpha-ketoglutarate-dependent taurine dioxygenase